MFQDDIKSYVDQNGLVSPTLVNPNTQRASDNGPLFSSQYLILSYLHKETPLLEVQDGIVSCIDASGLLHRAPGDTSKDAPDDYYGVLSFFLLIRKNLKPISLPPSCYQPMLLFMKFLQSSPLITHSFSFIAALIIIFSNVFEDKQNTSNKLLMWTTIKGLNQKSLLCALAGRVWTWRMKRIYGSTKNIAIIYFGEAHPFIKWWIE